jgi:hypothetical protein
MASAFVPSGMRPLKVSVAPSKLSQDGSGAPFDSVAVYASVPPFGSVNVSAASVKFIWRGPQHASQSDWSPSVAPAPVSGPRTFLRR